MQLAESGGEDRRDLAKAVRRRYDELDRIVYKLLEQNALGVISDERFRVMVTGYEQEQADLTQKIAGCKPSWINATPKAVTP
jgi:phosphate uptake regulator